MYLTPADLRAKINSVILAQIIGTDTEALTDAEATAAAILTDKLDPHYDIQAEFDQTGATRHRRVLNWMLSIVAYLLYERIPDDQVPERIIKDYDDTRRELAEIADGKSHVSLPRRLTDQTDQTGQARPKTKFRWGSIAPRTHNW